MKIKIDCERILSLLKSGYLDNALDDATREQVNQHLEECPACRRVKENLEAVSLLLRNAPRSNPPENLWARIEKEIRSARIRPIKPAGNFSVIRFKNFFTQRPVLAFAAAAALVLMAVGFHVMINRTNNGELAPSLSLLIGNDEMREPNMNFGSNIEKYLL